MTATGSSDYDARGCHFPQPDRGRLSRGIRGLTCQGICSVVMGIRLLGVLFLLS